MIALNKSDWLLLPLLLLLLAAWHSPDSTSAITRRSFAGFDDAGRTLSHPADINAGRRSLARTVGNKHASTCRLFWDQVSSRPWVEKDCVERRDAGGAN